MRRPRLVRCAMLASLVLTVLAGNGVAQEWARFRGPNGSGISEAKGIPVSWTEADYCWTLDLPGEGISSPVLWGEKLFVTSAEVDTGQRWLLCIDAAAGKELWRKSFPFDKYKKHKVNTFATSTPAADAERVYVLWQAKDASQLTAFDHEGNEVWSFDVGPFEGGHGGGISPIVYEDLVIVGNDQEGPSSIIAVEAKTGKLGWQTERSSTRATYATPCVFQAPGREPELVFTDWQQGITGIDPKTGERKWEIAVFGDRPERAIGSPVVAGDLVIGTCGFVTSKKHLVAVKPSDTADGVKIEEIYRFEKAAPHLPTPIVVGDLLFAITEQGIGTCLDVKTGEQVWQKRIGGSFAGSPVCVDGKLYTIDEDGTVVVIAAGREYEELARNELGELSRSTPAVANGRMYLRTLSKVFCVGGK